MKPSRFAYQRPGELSTAIALLAGTEDAKVIAGGQSLAPMINLRLARPALLVDITALRGLDYVRRDPLAGLRIGSLATHAQIEHFPAPLAGYEAITQAMSFIGHPPIRLRGTVGGSIAHADPTAEWCVVAQLFDAVVVLAGPRGRREVPVATFHTGPFTTTIEPDEVITEIVFTAPAGRSAFLETAAQRGDFATVAVGVAFDTEDGRAVRPRVAVAGLSSHPIRVPSVERHLAGHLLAAGSRTLLAELRAELAELGAQSERTELAPVAGHLVVRALDRAWTEAA